MVSNNKNRIILQAVVFVILIVMSMQSVSAGSYETTSVSRIVGESPTEMLRQMQRTEIDLTHATYYSDQIYNQKGGILGEQFPDNVDVNLQNPIFPWYFTDARDSVNSFGKNEFFVLETDSNINPLDAKTGYSLYDYYFTIDQIYPGNTKDWQNSFELNNPLLFWDSPYAGAYLPKEDSFVSRLVRDSTIIAPTSFNSPEFTKSFLCQLVGEKNIGEIFKDARNFHYGGGSESSSDNYIGLVLQSYALYGNPRQRINMQWNEADKEKIKKTYCKNYLENLAPGIEFLEYVGNYSKFRKHILFEIPDYSVDAEGDYLLINAENTYQRIEFGELVLPMAVRTTHFPTNTLITNYTLEYVGDPIDITVIGLPSYEFELVNRTCYYDNESYNIEFHNAYTQNSQDFIAKINPVETLNCTEGRFRLYRKINYSVDYIPLSPVLIKNINSPVMKPINSVVDVNIKLMPLTHEPVAGMLTVFDEDNNKLWEQETFSNITDYNASFFAGGIEELKKYTVEFILDNHTLTYNGFSVYITALEPMANIPLSAGPNPDIDINFYSHLSESFDLKGKYYLQHNDEIRAEGEFTKMIQKGDNIHMLSFSGLTREEQSYTLTIELDYFQNKRTLTYLINTNNAPILHAATSQLDYLERDKVIINYDAIDYDSDILAVSINDSRFIQKGNSFEWQTNDGDNGTYNFIITISDGILSDTQAVSVTVNKQNQDTLSGWWDSGWNRRKEIVIQNNDHEVTNYSIMLNVTYDSDMQPDFDDLRFAGSGNAQLSYWIENKVDGSYADVWVKIPYLVNTTDTKIWMYYGNDSEVSSESDIKTAFLYGDDFNDGSLDTSLWNTTNSPVESDGVLHIISSGYVGESIYTKHNVSIPFEITAQLKSSAVNQWNVIVGLGTIFDTNQLFLAYHGGVNYWHSADDVGNSAPWPVSNDNNKWANITIQIPNSSYAYLEKVSSTGTQTKTYTTPVELSHSVYFGSWHSSGWTIGDGDVDNVIIRRYLSTEPTYSIGAEEEYAVNDTAPPTYPDNWMNATFTKRREVSIQNTDMEVANYSIMLNVTYDSDMQPDFDDLRFAGSGNAQLSYWIENKVDGSYADVWVKIPYLVNTTDTKIWMYYGNDSEVSSESDISEAFIFGDSFEDTDFTEWSVIAGSPGISRDSTHSGTDGDYAIKINCPNDNVCYTETTVPEDEYVLEADYYEVGYGSYNTVAQNHIELWNASNTDQYLWYGYEPYIAGVEEPDWSYRFSNDNSQVDTGEQRSAKWVHVKYIVNSSGSSIWGDGTVNGTYRGTYTKPTEVSKIRLNQWAKSYSGNDAWYDTIYLRKYLAIEPTYSIGAEDNWMNATFTKRREISIQNMDVEVANYSIMLNITYDTDMQPGFDDLRFAGSGNAQLSYWIENKVDGSYADVWVKIPYLVNTTDTKIWMYYGNDSDVSSESDISEAFIFGDSFEDTDFTEWSVIAGSPGISRDSTHSGTDGDYAIKINCPDDNVCYTETTVPEDEYVLEADYYEVGYGSYKTVAQNHIELWNASNTDQYLWYGYEPYIAGVEESDWSYRFSNDNSQVDTGEQRSAKWVHVKYIVNSSGSFIWGDGTANGTYRGTYTKPTEVSKIKLYQWAKSYSGNDAWYDTIYLRKYLATEPTYSIGAEEV